MLVRLLALALTIFAASLVVGTFLVPRGNGPVEVTGSGTPPEHGSRTAPNVLSGGDFVTRAPDGEAHVAFDFGRPRLLEAAVHSYPTEISPQYRIYEAAIQWSDDGSTWTEVARGYERGGRISFDLRGSGAHQRWRVLVIKSGEAPEVVIGTVSFGWGSGFWERVPVDAAWLALIPAFLLCARSYRGKLGEKELFLSFAIPIGCGLLALSLAYAPVRTLFSPDSESYLFPLISTGFAEYRNSGYPSFLLLVGKMDGIRHLPFLQLAIQLASWFVAVWLIGGLYSWIWLRPILLLLVFVYGISVEYAAFVGTEALFAAGLTIAAAALATAARRPTIGVIILGALGLAVATAAKSIGIVLVAPAVLLVRFLPPGRRLRPLVILLAPALATYALMAAHSYSRTGHPAPESFAGMALIGHVGWMLEGSGGPIPELAAKVGNSVEPVLAQRPQSLTRIRSHRDLDTYVDYTSNEYNTLLYQHIMPTVGQAVSTHRAQDAYMLGLALSSIRARPIDYVIHVGAHFYGMWRELGSNLKGFQAVAMDIRSQLASVSDSEMQVQETKYGAIMPNFPARSELVSSVQQQAKLPLVIDKALNLRPTKEFKSVSLLVGALCLLLSVIFFTPFANTYGPEIMLAFVVNAYFLGHALMQVVLSRYTGVALPAVTLLVVCAVVTTFQVVISARSRSNVQSLSAAR